MFIHKHWCKPVGTLLLGAFYFFASHSAWANPAEQLAEVARKQVGVTQLYDPRYVVLQYPGGDVPPERGVCTDVVIRALRGQSVDLQQLVHEDMRANFASYPTTWGLAAADSNIDHRRVPNLETFFRRKGKAVKPVAGRANDYRPGDIVSWNLPTGQTHIGVLSTRKSRDGKRWLVVHNIGRGAQEEDVLQTWVQRGHFRWF
jgi:uncharacterized protein